MHLVYASTGQRRASRIKQGAAVALGLGCVVLGVWLGNDIGRLAGAVAGGPELVCLDPDLANRSMLSAAGSAIMLILVGLGLVSRLFERGQRPANW